LQPARAIDGDIELVAGIGERALGVEIADGGEPRSQAQLGAFRNGVLAAANGHAMDALDLIQEIGELGPRPLEAGGIDVGDVVGDDLDVQLLGRHARRRDG
jgi:hypothetical protein